jgi:uncharacterized membrane protein HdeD (DUF308 family)
MGILTIILGVLLSVVGVCCFFTPFATFLAAGYIIGIMLFIYGIFSLVRSIQTKAGALAYITSILAIVVGFLAIFRPGGTLVIDFLILIFVAIWFLIQGLTGIVVSIQRRKEISHWGLGLVVGILGIVVGVLCLIFPYVEMFAVGILIGIFLLEAGLSLITVGSVFGSVDQEH